ncbi:MAG: sulfotransferase [Pseudomonadota bacterium]
MSDLEGTVMGQIERFLPNLFVIGVAKAGSTSLTHWLCSHPEIVSSHDQELRFLMDETDPLARKDGYGATGLHGYRAMYPDEAYEPQVRYRLDTTPQYYYQDTAKRVIGEIPGSRVIFTLRDPVDRLLSLFRYAQNNIGVVPKAMPFSEFVQHLFDPRSSDIMRDRPMLEHAIKHSTYAPYVKEWSSLLGPERVEVVFFEELVREPANEMMTLAQALGLDPSAYEGVSFARFNESFAVRSQRLHRLGRRVRRSTPDWMRSLVKPLYMGLNTGPAKKHLSDDDRRSVEALRAHFGDWKSALPQTGRMLATAS